MLVGTTGAGKTTLLRHMIGSDPVRDRFPSTSTAKTTIADFEVVLAHGPYSAVVTFFSEFWVQANIEECVADAAVGVWEGLSDAKIAERLLNHRDQRFRLSYTLGSWSEEQNTSDGDDWTFDSDAEVTDIDDEGAISERERENNLKVLREFVTHIRSLSDRAIEMVSKDLSVNVPNLSDVEREIAQEYFEARLQQDDAFDNLVHDIMDVIRKRFSALKGGHLTHHPSGWPEVWTLEIEDRDEFISHIRWFSSNTAQQFGKLLTPIVDGIRVRGPLFPTYLLAEPKLVILDGQGLGHTPDSSASVTTQITKRFEDVDVILLVDNAQQPMQAAPLSVVRAVTASGHQQKLGIAFTHFDQVKGVNIPDFPSKRAHVMASVTNGLTNLREVLGAAITRALERTIDDQCFMLGGLDQASSKLPKGVKVELERMHAFFNRAIEPPPQVETRPVYNPDGLVLALQSAARSFRMPWRARLGLDSHGTFHKEHWTRVKALNRRIAGELSNEYDTLRPVADLVARLIEEASRYLDNPSSWHPRLPSEEEADAVLSAIRQRVYSRLHSLADQRLIKAHLSDWRDAFDHSGKGSTFERAQGIANIYDQGAPVPSTVVSPITANFIKEMRQLVHQAILEEGGHFEGALAS